MGGCASRPKESDMNNDEGSVPNKPVSETVVAKETNTEENSEKQNQTETETVETTSVQPKETPQVEPAKETAPSAEPELAVVGESSCAGEAAPVASEEIENVAVPTENTEAVVNAAAVAAPEKVEVAVEAAKVADAEPVKEEEKEAVVTV